VWQLYVLRDKYGSYVHNELKLKSFHPSTLQIQLALKAGSSIRMFLEHCHFIRNNTKLGYATFSMPDPMAYQTMLLPSGPGQQAHMLGKELIFTLALYFSSTETTVNSNSLPGLVKT
jgi:hypothetical protein